MADRYHRAAQDGYLEVLREATKKDCNTKDEDGMTPTLWAAFEGNLDALRLLVGRGGDPEKSDNYGNTALHLSSARGHMPCVTFLVNFGVNMWSMDIDQHTPQELAAMNDCTDILRYLDVVASKQETEDARKTAKAKEAAEKDVQKLIKNFKKVQKKADKQATKKDQDLEREKKKMMEGPGTLDARRESVAVQQSNYSFSDMTGVGKGGTTRSKKMIGTVFRKANVQKARVQDAHFKVRGLEDGKKTVRNLSGLRRDSEIMFVAPKEESGDIGDEDISVTRGGSAEPATGELPGRLTGRRDTFGIFDRPGFGSVAFRRDSMAATLYAVQNDSTGDRDSQDQSSDDGGGGAHDSDDGRGGGGGGDGFGGAIDMFLAGLGLPQYIKVFKRQKIDLETLMLLNEQNLLEMKIEIGPRKKILKAIDDRKRDLEQDNAIEDSQL